MGQGNKIVPFLKLWIKAGKKLFTLWKKQQMKWLNTVEYFKASL